MTTNMQLPVMTSNPLTIFYGLGRIDTGSDCELGPPVTDPTNSAEKPARSTIRRDLAELNVIPRRQSELLSLCFRSIESLAVLSLLYFEIAITIFLVSALIWQLK